MPIELLLAASGLLAGAFGALLGLGGGVLIVPILTLGFGVPLPTAVGTSLIGVIATSTGAAAINVRAGRADVRLGLTLAAGTVVGALTGGVLAGFAPERLVAGLFAAMLAYTALTMARGLVRRAAVRAVPGDRDGTRPEPAAGVRVGARDRPARPHPAARGLLRAGGGG